MTVGVFVEIAVGVFVSAGFAEGVLVGVLVEEEPDVGVNIAVGTSEGVGVNVGVFADKSTRQKMHKSVPRSVVIPTVRTA